MNSNNRNMILAIVLSAFVLIGWQYFIAGPQAERAQRNALAQQQAAASQSAAPTAVLAADGTLVAVPAPAPGEETYADRASAIAASPRVGIETASLIGSIRLKGARLDDLRLKKYTETVDPKSAIITLLTPAGAPGAYFVEQGWVAAIGEKALLPNANSDWTLENGTTLSDTSPITLKWDNGQGLIFHRSFAVDADYLFTITDSVENKGGSAVALSPAANVVRQGTPKVSNFFVQHEGPLGVLGSNNLIAKKYSDLQGDSNLSFSSDGGWVGITDKYWATAVLSEPAKPIGASFSYSKPAGKDVYQTGFVETNPISIAPGATATSTSYTFAGAKVEATIAAYESKYKFDRLELLIDWGWLHFLTYPMFLLIRLLNGLIGNFGLAMLAVTVIVKGLFFPLANRSYASMAAMRRVAPEMKALQERFKEDRPAQQQAMMELYKREKINPLSGCWPILIQIPVFFSLYTVLFISLEMRHAPFFGWIHDLAAPDPTNIFTLFGLIPWDPTALPILGGFLHLGIWPVIMGITMWVQMKLNPPPPDPTQAAIFAFMPIIFTFMLGTFPAGLVIYWSWNNFLSICQQWFIMKRHGAEVDLFGNILVGLGLRKAPKTT